MERFVEVGNHFVPNLLAFGNFVELQLYIGSKVIVKDIFEIFYQEISYQQTNIGREQFIFFGTGNFDFTFRCYFSALKGGKVATESKIEITGAEKNKLFPTDIGLLVTDFLVENFKDI